jgi:hypothetical protein
MKADEKKCPDCAELIKKNAAVCKHCGHRFTSEEIAAGRRDLVAHKWGCAALVVGFLLLAYCIVQTPTTNTNSTASSGTNGEANSASAPEGAAASKWTYSEERDEMRGRTNKYAQLVSENEQEFDFPYNGGSHLNIFLQKFQKPDTEVLLRLEKGQFVCHSFTGGSVSVRFDGGPVRKFGCSETSDGDTSTIFLHPAGTFVAALKKSSKATVEAEFFQEGVRQFIFDTSGLKWQ